MRKLIFLPVLLVVFLLTTQSCTKQSRDEMGIAITETIEATVSSANPYVLNMNNYGTVSIGRQAAFFDVSTTEIIGESATLVYKYLPKKGYTGPDEVELISSKPADRSAAGCGYGGGVATTSKHSRVSRILIKFTVTN